MGRVFVVVSNSDEHLLDDLLPKLETTETLVHLPLWLG